tara:strand:+ start:738 stop:1370 length:633 start_codon:yes stop_codon:yes gene_type:complete
MNRVKVYETSAGLASIKEPDTELVIWQRSLPSDLQNWINQTDAACLPDVRILIKPDEFRPALEPLLERCGLRAGDMRSRLVADIHGLVIAFAEITRRDYVDVRLERVSQDACWKFHRDIVETRLVTTYRGPATEWVRPVHAEQAIQEQREYNGPLECLGGGNVAIFKGSYVSPNRGIVHRSPPIAGTNLIRLLLCLNQWTRASPDPWIEA